MTTIQQLIEQLRDVSADAPDRPVRFLLLNEFGSDYSSELKYLHAAYAPAQDHFIVVVGVVE